MSRMKKAVGKYWVTYGAESFGVGRESWNGVWAIFDHDPVTGSVPVASGETEGGHGTANPAIDQAKAAGVARANELDEVGGEDRGG